MWTNWPAREMTPQMKWYLLMQLSFWIQQIFIVNIEERRKDHYQMLTHHLITSTLLGSAYIYRFYNVSNVVLCLMDIVDFLLPVSEPTLNHGRLSDERYPDRQDLEVLWLRNLLQCRFWGVPVDLVYCAPCRVFVGVLVGLHRSIFRPPAIWLLFGSDGGDADTQWVP
jgi:hypothetical protein